MSSGPGPAPVPSLREAAPGAAEGRERRRTLAGSIPVAASPERAWQIFSRVDDWPLWDWFGAAEAAWVAGEPWAVGSVLRLGHRPIAYDCVIVEVDPPRQVSWMAGVAGMRGRHTVRFEPHADGCLVVTRGEFAGPAVRLARPAARWCWRRSLRGFRDWVAAHP